MVKFQGTVSDLLVKHQARNLLRDGDRRFVINDSVIDSTQDRYQELSFAYAFFVLYLVFSAASLPASKYHSEWIAYFATQGSGLAAMIGAASIVIAGQVDYCLAKIRVLPLELENDEEERAAIVLVFKWIARFSWLSQLLHDLFILSIFVFCISFCAQLFNVYLVEGLNFAAFFALVASVLSFTAGLLFVLSSSANKLIIRLQLKFSQTVYYVPVPSLFCG